MDTTESARLKTARAAARAENPNKKLRDFARECRKLRESLNMDQSQFGRQLGVKGRTVSRWETMSGHLPGPTAMEIFRKLQYANRLEKGDPKPEMNPSKFRK